MSMTTPRQTLETELTQLTLATAGVTRLYPPIRTVPIPRATLRLFPDLDRAAARVLIDPKTQTVTASLGLDTSAPAADILQAVCSRLQEHLARTTNEPRRIRLTIVHIAD